MSGLPLLATFFERDPFLGYTLIATLFLAIVSLSAGLSRLDFLVSFRPRALLHISLAVLLAFMLVFLADFLKAQNIDQTWLSILKGLSRFPLYVIALAYGPSAGLLAGLLFAGFATSGASPGWLELLLTLELCVLGWFAIAPSTFRVRWAGPANVVLAYALTWIAAGSAYLQWRTGEAARFSTHFTQHVDILPSILLSVLLLALLRPSFYQRHFHESRIAPQSTFATPTSDADVFVEPLPEPLTEKPLPAKRHRTNFELTQTLHNPSPFMRARHRKQLQTLRFDELRRPK